MSDLANHSGFSRVFKPNRLTFGFIAPFKGYEDGLNPDLSDMFKIAKFLDDSVAAALWVRDVPFCDPNFGDVGQVYDPFVTLGFLAANTKNIAIGSAGIISTLREPIFTAKAALSLNEISNERFILGLSTGDRLSEYPAFGADFENRGDRFSEGFNVIKALFQEPFLKMKTKFYGEFNGENDLLPKPKTTLPMIAIGRCRQELGWLANIPDAWLWHGVNPNHTAGIISTLKELNENGESKPFGFSNFLEISDDKNQKVELFNNIYLRGGTNALFEFFSKQKEQGLSHSILNICPTKRPAIEALADFLENVASKL